MNQPNAEGMGLDLFWEEAHLDESDEHPLDREISHRLDALHRYQDLIAEAEASGRDEMAELLIRQSQREAESLQRLRDASERLRAVGFRE